MLWQRQSIAFSNNLIYSYSFAETASAGLWQRRFLQIFIAVMPDIQYNMINKAKRISV